MNLYFVLEGESTETKLYPKWLEYSIPKLTRVFFEKDVIKYNYYIFSAGGFPSIYNHIINAIKNINDNPVFKKLIICFDGEEVGYNQRIEIAKKKIEESGVKLNENCEIVFIVQNVCIETWFLGNRRIVKRNSQNQKLINFLNHYDITSNDPELMEKMKEYRNKADFHYYYLREVFKEHGLNYTKRNPGFALDKSYYDQLLNRTSETNHLPSLKSFFDLLNNIKKSIN